MVPTSEQSESVMADIERLQAERVGDKPWADLTHGEKYVALQEIEWTGFTRKEELAAIARILAGEPRELWLDGIDRSESNRGAPLGKLSVEGASRQELAPDVDPKPRDSLFPSAEPVGFQVWHKLGQHYEHVASVQSNPLGAIMMTTHGFMGYKRWPENPAVSAVPGEHRSTDIGDVLIGPDGYSLEIAADDDLRLKPIAPIDRISADGSIAEKSVECMPNLGIAVGKPEREALLRENYWLTREIGYVGFRERFFNDPDAVKAWPVPDVRERALREFWNIQPAAGFASYAGSLANETTETLIAYRDYLRGLSASGKDTQIMFYEQISDLGRRERMIGGDDNQGGGLSTAYEKLVRLPGDFDSPLSPFEIKSLAEEIRQDEHAARVRDYGEADAAAYEARVRAGGILSGISRRTLHLSTPTRLERLLTDLKDRWVAQTDPAGNARVERGGLDLADEKVVYLPPPLAAKPYVPSPGDLADQRYEPDVGRGERGPSGGRGR